MSFDERRSYDLFLDVRYSEKDKAKDAGAWWDSGRRKWFVPARQSVVPFVRWLPSDERAAHDKEVDQRQRLEQHYERSRELGKLPPQWTDPQDILRQLGRRPVYDKYGFCGGCDSRLAGWYICNMELRHNANTDYGTFHKRYLVIIKPDVIQGWC